MDDDWLSTGDVAEIFGVSRQHVVDLCDRGNLPCTRFGTHRRVRCADLERIVEPQLTQEQQRSLWLHRAVLGELMLEPDRVLKTARSNIERFKSVHRPDGMSLRYLDQWQRAIDSGVEGVVKVLIGTDEQSCELRQNSPFAGILADGQRQRVLRSFRQHRERTHEEKKDRAS